MKMSDGNYNKNILPYNNYQSGVRAGKASERKRCLDAFKQIFHAVFPDMSPEEEEKYIKQFLEKIDDK